MGMAISPDDPGDAAEQALFALVSAPPAAAPAPTGAPAPLFRPAGSLRALAEANSLKDVSALPAVKALVEAFTLGGARPEVAFNQGTRAFGLVLKVAAQGGEPPAGDAAAGVVWTMLALWPAGEQAAREERYRRFTASRGCGAHREGRRGGAGAGPGGAPAPGVVPEPLLANACLALFEHQTGAALTSVARDLRMGTARVSFAALRDTARSDAAARAWRWAPCYARLGGESQDALVALREEVAGELMADFWRRAEAARYVPDAGLVECLSGPLRSYLAKGLAAGRAAGFVPPRNAEPLSLYLWGTAGVGKSEFVKVLQSSLRGVLRSHVLPTMEVTVVKVLLNSLTAQDMRAVANVKGISDMSVERLCEQAVSKGHLVVLHLEENPEDEELQAELFDVAKGILKSLMRRYPERAAHVMYVLTSNYPPAAALQQRVAPVKVSAPSPERQREWCVNMLHDTAAEVAGAASLSLEVDPAAYPPEGVGDMRRLRQWWVTLGFHLGGLVRASLGEGEPGGGDERTAEASLRAGAAPGELVAAAGGKTLALRSHDRVFWFEEGKSAHPVLSEMGVAPERQPRMVAVVDMLAAGYLKPGVLVLTGTDAGRSRALGQLRALLSAELPGDRVSEAEVTLTTEADKEKVFGKPDEVQGGLFAFVDSVNNANLADQGRFALVVAHVNETGQFALRELLESGASATHRLAVRKERVLFVLSAQEGCALQPPLVSRAHDVVQCD